MTTAGSSALAYDLRGNMSSDGSVTYSYNANNLLTSVSAPTAATLVYDAENRLQTYTAGGTTTKFLYDGVDLIAEYNASGTLLRRYVHGPGDDEPLVWYEGTGTTTRRFFVADERGSIVAVTDSAGTALAINKYNEYGVPTTSNATYAGRFRYTGQVWLPEISLAYYKARIYAPTVGRFLQTDPIGYGDGMNWYAYVHNDPINGKDPSGLLTFQNGGGGTCEAHHYQEVGLTQDGLPNRSDVITDYGFDIQCSGSYDPTATGYTAMGRQGGGGGRASVVPRARATDASKGEGCAYATGRLDEAFSVADGYTPPRYDSWHWNDAGALKYDAAEAKWNLAQAKYLQWVFYGGDAYGFSGSAIELAGGSLPKISPWIIVGSAVAGFVVNDDIIRKSNDLRIYSLRLDQLKVCGE